MILNKYIIYILWLLIQKGGQEEDQKEIKG